LSVPSVLFDGLVSSNQADPSLEALPFSKDNSLLLRIRARDIAARTFVDKSMELTPSAPLELIQPAISNATATRVLSSRSKRGKEKKAPSAGTGLRNVIGSHNEDHVKASLSPPSTPLLVTYEERLETLTFSLPREGEGKRRRRAREMTRGRTADGRTGSAVASTSRVYRRERERERHQCALRLLFRVARSARGLTGAEMCSAG